MPTEAQARREALEGAVRDHLEAEARKESSARAIAQHVRYGTVAIVRDHVISRSKDGAYTITRADVISPPTIEPEASPSAIAALSCPMPSEV